MKAAATIVFGPFFAAHWSPQVGTGQLCSSTIPQPLNLSKIQAQNRLRLALSPLSESTGPRWGGQQMASEARHANSSSANMLKMND